VSRALVRACHPLPTVAVTGVVTACAWSLGWRGPSLAGVLLAVLLGQLSVGWSNDAVDAEDDERAGRVEKPTVSGAVTVRALWVVACVALAASAAQSWHVAGLTGGSFHVAAVLLAWGYNAGLSRTSWSWVPYALAFGCVPPFLTFGLDGSPPPLWLVAVFSIIGVSAHVANALRDLASDRGAGLGGAVVRWGPVTSARAGWGLLALGTLILAVVAARRSVLLLTVVLAGFLGARTYAARSGSPNAMFHGLLIAVAVDMVAVVVAAS
jgi:4-hydroxybenzoate polyprenyltransferase